MSRWWLVFNLGLVLAGSFVVPSEAAPGSVQDRILLTDREAILLAPPELVASWEVRQADWSPDGKYVLAHRNLMKLPPLPVGPPDLRHSLVLWNAEERKGTEVWKGGTRFESVQRLGWVAVGGVAFAVVRREPNPQVDAPLTPPRAWLVRLDARRPTLRSILEVKPDSQLHVTPGSTWAVLSSDSERVLRVLRADGIVSRQVAYPAGAILRDPSWSRDHKQLIFTILPDTGKPVPGPPARLSFDPGSGQLTPFNGSNPLPEGPDTPAPSAEVQLLRSESTLLEGNTRCTITPLWLRSTKEGTPERALVSPDAEWGKLSPRGDAVMYESEGSVCVSFFVRLPKEQFQQARATAMKAVAISNAKQLGLGILIWANENDDTYPNSGQPIWDLLRPIVKNESLELGFVYTFAGGKLSSLEKPSETLLGYVAGPGGRAEIWADGHVTWKQD